MNNKNEYEKILKIVDEDSYLRDEDFTDNCAKKFRNVRVLFYIVVFIGSFLVIQDGRIIPTNNLMVSAIAIIMPAVGFFYLKQRNNLHREINRYVFRECYPDRGLSRYLSFVPLMLRGEMIWSITQYNFGCIYYRLGKIGKANALLNLMQESCTTAGNMLLAEHLKQLIALYYKDYDTVITCANESAMLYPKVRRTIWNTKIYNDIQRFGAYANCCRDNDYQQVYSILQDPQERPLDEVTRYYYLFLTAIALNDYETAENYKRFVKQNAGTTWYGNAVNNDFIPERKPDNYPGFVMNMEKLNKPDKIDKSRLKYALIGVLIVLLFYLLPRL